MGLKKFNEFVQLDEISKQTLGSYIKKARTDAINQRDDAHDSNRLARSMSGDDTRKEYEKKRDTHVRKFGNRNRGIDKAVDKLVKEGIEAVSEEELDEIFENYEQLDELSKQTLGRYINAASDKGMQSAHIAGGGTGYRHDGDKADRSKEFSKAVKRLKGIRKATDKLVKEGAEALSFDELELLGESFEMLNELSKQTLSNYIVKSARDMYATGYEQGKAYGRGASNGEVKPMIRRANKRRAGIIRASDKLAEEELSESKTHLLHTDSLIPGTHEKPKRIQVTTGKTKHDVQHHLKAFGTSEAWSTRNHQTGEVTHHDTAEDLVNHLKKAGHKGLKPEHFSRDQFHREVGTKQTISESEESKEPKVIKSKYKVGPSKLSYDNEVIQHPETKAWHPTGMKSDGYRYPTKHGYRTPEEAHEAGKRMHQEGTKVEFHDHVFQNPNRKRFDK